MIEDRHYYIVRTQCELQLLYKAIQPPYKWRRIPSGQQPKCPKLPDRGTYLVQVRGSVLDISRAIDGLLSIPPEDSDKVHGESWLTFNMLPTDQAWYIKSTSKRAFDKLKSWAGLPIGMEGIPSSKLGDPPTKGYAAATRIPTSGVAVFGPYNSNTDLLQEIDNFNMKASIDGDLCVVTAESLDHTTGPYRTEKTEGVTEIAKIAKIAKNEDDMKSSGRAKTRAESGRKGLRFDTGRVDAPASDGPSKNLGLSFKPKPVEGACSSPDPMSVTRPEGRFKIEDTGPFIIFTRSAFEVNHVLKWLDDNFRKGDLWWTGQRPKQPIQFPSVTFDPRQCQFIVAEHDGRLSYYGIWASLIRKIEKQRGAVIARDIPLIDKAATRPDPVNLYIRLELAFKTAEIIHTRTPDKTPKSEKNRAQKDTPASFNAEDAPALLRALADLIDK